MESDVNYTLVGAFVIGLFAAAIIIVLWLSASLSEQHTNLYLAYMNESVAGLSVDATVKYNGVDIGTVREISLNPHDLQQVKLLLAINDNIPIKSDTRATVTSQGLTGLSYINLSGGSTISPLLKRMPNEDYPVIQTTPSLFFRVDSALDKLTRSAINVSNDLDKVLGKDNQVAFQRILKNMDELSTVFAENSAQINNSLKYADAALKHTSSASKQLPDTLNQMNQTLTTVQHLATRLDGLTGMIEKNPAMLIRGHQPAPLGPGEQ